MLCLSMTHPLHGCRLAIFLQCLQCVSIVHLKDPHMHAPQAGEVRQYHQMINRQKYACEKPCPKSSDATAATRLGTEQLMAVHLQSE